MHQNAWRPPDITDIMVVRALPAPPMELSRVSPIVLRWAQLAGVGLDELRLAAGLDADDIVGGVTHANGMRLWRALEMITNDPFVGLTVGARATLDFMGALGAMFSTAHDLADGLRVLGRALPLLLQHEALQIETSALGGAVCYRSPNENPRHGVDSLFASILTLARECTEHHIVPLAVQLQHAPPAVPAPYAALYGVAPAFNQDACVLRFGARDLERPFRGSDPRTNTLLLQHAGDLVGPPPEYPLEEIERALVRAMDSGDASLSAVSRMLNVSARTLQRRLAEYGASFEDLRSRVRYEAALEQIDRGVPVSKVATALGYASRTAFSRAFRRWTGSSPASYASGLRRHTAPDHDHG